MLVSTTAVLEGAVLISLALGLTFSSVAGSRAHTEMPSPVTLYWRDARFAGWTWSAAAAATLASLLLSVDGLSSPVWALVVLASVLVVLGLLTRRWRSPAMRAHRAQRASDPPARRLVSTTWEVGILVGGAAGLAVYAVAMSHQWAHPFHWALAILAIGLGYAVGVAAATPRYRSR